MCENCVQLQQENEELLTEISDLKDEIKTLEMELSQIDKWKDQCPR